MIHSKRELHFFIMADRIMNGLSRQITLKERMMNCINGTPEIAKYLMHMRCLAYYKSRHGLFNKIITVYHRNRYNKLGVKLGFYINEDVFDYGLCVPHYGTFRVGGNNHIGRYAVIHTVSNITASNCIIGDGLYLSVGAKIIGPLVLGDNVSVTANSVVNKSFDSNILLAGAPATVKKENYQPWYVRDGETYTERVKRVEALRQEMGLINKP